ncbi:hypothetical protein CNMCM7691_008238 [Aspergillus felis]|uniref:Xylanolytic transcriptional activator regulatory domain-containing protein n=1 Tax=Aspergillus felis TaxID=1287682 RepID=A0A8H6V667_9EURO|nr:hypothetical protein CNMCM7691_008238 [Aspergillus felis]
MPASDISDTELPPRYNFIDDYSEGAHPQILESLLLTNSAQQSSYGTDEFSNEARRLIREKLNASEDEVAIHFVPSGTSANLISIASCLRPYEAVMAVESGHIVTKEAGAIEATGHKMILVPGVNGKMTPENLERVFQQNQFFPHMAKPRLVYISNATELGTIYTKAELSALSAVCKRLRLLILVDGARLGVALSAKNNDLTLRDMVDLTDIFWIGGTKMGALLGEAIVVKQHLAEGFVFHLKQHGALLAKSRVMGIQFVELFRTHLFFDLATHANNMAAKISANFEKLGYSLAEQTETNQVFPILPDRVVRRLQDRFGFYIWEKRDDGHAVVRIVTSWATDSLQVDKFNSWVQQWTELDLTDTYSSPSRKSKRTALKSRRQRRVISEPTTALNSPPLPPEPQPDHPSPWCAENPVEALPSSTVIAACETYRKKFPVANFLHYPSLIAELSSNPASVDPVFVAALLSLCVRFMPDHPLEAAETYAEYARKQLAHRAFDAPSLYLAQSLVMITFYEWGSGRPYKAWMYSGMATYMIQSLLKTADDSMEHNPQDFQASQTQYEQLVRTYWCCFAQDCELSSGARQHFALSFRQISVPLPTSDQDFNFGRLSSPRLMPSDMSKHSPLSRNLTIDYGLTIVTRGFDIFVRILRFANESRRGRTLTFPQDPSSPRVVWQRLKEELDEWRFLQDVTVRYPATSAQAHVALGYGELFAYINLVYFMSILFLFRDQFLSSLKPHADLLHDLQGLSNVDESQAIRQLFEAAQNIGGILSALEVSGAPVITPYSGFSIFVAAHINMYGTVCPQRYPGGIERAEEEKKANLLYLERLSKYWPVGQNWWRTVQEANRFYEIARNNQLHVRDGAGHLTIAGTLDEYGDIRSVRPRQEESKHILERERIENPKLVLIIGCVGLALNLISGLFLHEHDHGESNTPDSSDDDLEVSMSLSRLERRSSFSTRVVRPHVEHRHNVKSQAKKGHDLGMMGVFIHVLGDAANNLGVIIAALVIWKANYEGRYYADPAVSMAIAIVILLSSLPLVRKTGAILLQSAPLGVDPEDVKHDLEAIPGVESVHELHIWQLNQEKALASVHLAVSDELIADFMEKAKIINECFHAYGIHSTTLQPEHVRPIPSESRSIQGQETAELVVEGGVKKRHVVDPNSGSPPARKSRRNGQTPSGAPLSPVENWAAWPELNESCYIETAAYMPCQQGRISLYSAVVQNARHIQEAVRFAKQHNIRLAIKNSGHDFHGRSAAPNPLQILTN